jgi:hypothetical protein
MAQQAQKLTSMSAHSSNSPSNLLIRPLRLLLRRKRRHSNLLILAAKQPMEHPPLILDALPDAQILAFIHHVLARLDGNVAVARNLLRGGQSAVYALLGRVEHLGDEAPFARLLGRNVVACENRLHGPRLADRLGKALGPARARNNPQLDLGLAKHGLGPRVEDVAHHGQLAAAAQRVPVYGCDQGLLEEGDEVGPLFYEVVAVGGAEGEVGHLFDVGAGGEGFVRAGEDDGADGGGGLEGAEGGVEFEDEGGGEGIEGFGAVELDWRELAVFDLELLEP